MAVTRHNQVIRMTENGDKAIGPFTIQTLVFYAGTAGGTLGQLQVDLRNTRDTDDALNKRMALVSYEPESVYVWHFPKGLKMLHPESGIGVLGMDDNAGELWVYLA